MASSKAASSAPGKPFEKGNDPRRNKGNKNKEAQAFAIEFRNALAKGIKPKEIADLLIAQMKKNKPWAIQEYLDRMMGKSTQPINVGGQIDSKLTIEVIETK